MFGYLENGRKENELKSDCFFFVLNEELILS